MASKILDRHNFIQHLVSFLHSKGLDMVNKGVSIVGRGTRCVGCLFLKGVILTLVFFLVFDGRCVHVFFVLSSSVRALAFHVPLTSASEASSFGHAFALFGSASLEAFAWPVMGIVFDDRRIDVHRVGVSLRLSSRWTS